MDGQREERKDERTEVTGELSETELEQASGGLDLEEIKPSPRPWS